MPRRVCAIPGCDESLEGKHPLAKTCKPAHKQQLARINKAAEKRRARARAAEKRTGLEMLAAAAAGEAEDVARDVLREELRKYINRDALTEDVLADIAKLINHAPAAIGVLTTQLLSEDETVAQRAAALILKYTLGNASVAPAGQEAQAAPMQVVFNLPDRAEPAEEGEAAVLRACSDCGIDKAEDEFVGKSETCTDCFAARQAEITARFTKTDPTAPSDHAA